MAGTSKSMRIDGKAASTSGASTSRAGAASSSGASTSRAGAAFQIGPSTSRAGAASISGPSISRAGAASISGPSTSRAGAASMPGPSTSRAGAASISGPSTSRAGAASISGPSTSRAGAASMSGPSTSRAAAALQKGPSTSRAADSSATITKEFRIRIPETPKDFNIMRFNGSLDFTQWRDVEMEREKTPDDPDNNAPKVGAGRKKYVKQSKAVEQPWILKDGGGKGKKYKGTKSGGVSDNCVYYVFTQEKDGQVNANRVKDWYNFQPVQPYKTLSAEEAEQEFGRKEKVMNYFSLMVQKRLVAASEDAEEQEAEKGKLEKSTQKLKITDEEEWMDSQDSTDSDKSCVQRGKKAANKKKTKPAVCGDDSDDANEAGLEMDYYATSSEEEPDAEAKLNKEMKSVADVVSSDEDDAATESDDSEKDENEEKKEDKKKTKDVVSKKQMQKALSSDNSLSADFPDTKEDLSNGPIKKKSKTMGQVAAAAIAAAAAAATAAAATASGNNNSNKVEYVDFGGVTEEAVRRYIKRKPMTAAELLAKFKNKTSNLSNDCLLANMSKILKKINPQKQMIQGKMYFSI